MTTSIGYRWKGGNVRSRVVLIARQACAHASPVPGRGCNSFFVITCTTVSLRRYFLFGYLFLYYVKALRVPQRGAFYGSALKTSPFFASPLRVGTRGATVLGGHGDGAHPLPFRTGKLRPFAPMVLLYQVGE